MNGCLLMAHQDVLDLVLLVKLVVNVKDRAAGIAPDEFDLLFGKRLHQDGSANRVTRVFAGVEGKVFRRGEFRAGHIHSFTFQIFGKKLIGCSPQRARGTGSSCASNGQANLVSSPSVSQDRIVSNQGAYPCRHRAVKKKRYEMCWLSRRQQVAK